MHRDTAERAGLSSLDGSWLVHQLRLLSCELPRFHTLQQSGGVLKRDWINSLVRWWLQLDKSQKSYMYTDSWVCGGKEKKFCSADDEWSNCLLRKCLLELVVTQTDVTKEWKVMITTLRNGNITVFWWGCMLNIQRLKILRGTVEHCLVPDFWWNITFHS